MSFPNDLSDVTVFKIHPAIGVARLSRGTRTFIFGEGLTRYKANRRMKRPCVRFRIFAYDRDNEGLGELTPDIMNVLEIQAVWTVTAADRKIARQRNDNRYEVTATASSDTNDGELIGHLPLFAEAGQIRFGRITPDGVFTPPAPTVHRETPTTPIQSGALYYPDVIDNTCDGSVSITLPQNGETLQQPILGAWLLVAPQDFSPDINDARLTLESYLTTELSTPNIPPVNPVHQTARILDRSVLRHGTGVFSPGIESSFRLSAEVTDTRQAFQTAAQTGDPDEIRVHIQALGERQGVRPGMLTSGLCSPWQADFLLCTCGFWPAQHLDAAFKDDSSQQRVRWLRKRYDDAGTNVDKLETTQEIIDHVDKLGVIRLRNGRPAETERTGDIP
jgi:hypothetical protein